MKEPYLEVTYRHGQPIAAYYYLPREVGDRSHKTRREKNGILVDFNRDGRPIGVEITAPKHTSVAAVNEVLMELDQGLIDQADLAPLLVA